MDFDSMNEALSERVVFFMGRGDGLGGSFNQLRKLKWCQYLSDYAIFRFILIKMDEMGRMPARSTIRYHFRDKVDKEDWEGVNKHQVLKTLYQPLGKVDYSTDRRKIIAGSIQKRKKVSIPISLEYASQSV